jgi:hypothetical protein
MHRAFVYGVSVLLVGLVLWPAFRDPPRDSFPLSDYPMFSYGRPSARTTISHALGVTDEGERVPLPPIVSAANREVLQSMMIIENAIGGGPARVASFCNEVAARVAERRDDADFARFVAVEIATSTYDGVAYFAGDTGPLERRVHARCVVPR